MWCVINTDSPECVLISFQYAEALDVHVSSVTVQAVAASATVFVLIGQHLPFDTSGFNASAQIVALQVRGSVT